MTLQNDSNHIQRAFLAWLSGSNRLFATPLTITKHSKQSIELAFTNANSMISATLTSREINIQFHWNDVCWDFLIYFEAVPELYRDYYVCSLRHPEDDTFYESRELLWELRLFEPFLAWVNNTLTKMPWIEVYEHKKIPKSVKLLDTLPTDCCIMSNHGIIIANPLYKKVTFNPH